MAWKMKNLMLSFLYTKYDLVPKIIDILRLTKAQWLFAKKAVYLLKKVATNKPIE